MKINSGMAFKGVIIATKEELDKNDGKGRHIIREHYPSLHSDLHCDVQAFYYSHDIKEDRMTTSQKELNVISKLIAEEVQFKHVPCKAISEFVKICEHKKLYIEG